MSSVPATPIAALREHWPEYAIEATLLGSFMFIACLTVAAVQHPLSPIAPIFKSNIMRRGAIGLIMGSTAIALIYSPLGARSGAHMNPATTLTFFTLGKVALWDAVWYIFAQFIGGAIGVRAARLVIPQPIQHESVVFALTRPGRHGARVAWLAEVFITFIMMLMVLSFSNHQETAPYTGLMAGVLVAVFILVEAPLSGMSMNPARTLASALHAKVFRHLWIYFTAPPLGMLAAALLYSTAIQDRQVHCAKLNHEGHSRCIFRCHIDDLRSDIP